MTFTENGLFLLCMRDIHYFDSKINTCIHLHTICILVRFVQQLNETVMTNSQERQKAIELYKAIAAGKVEGMQIKKRIIKVGSITFLP
jgi:hypothetical protein